MSAAWDLGHIVAFSLWSDLFIAWNRTGESSPARQWGIILLFCLAGGAVTEGIQFLLGGDSSPGDLLRDLLGGVITLSRIASSAKVFPERMRQVTRKFAATLLLVACLPLAALGHSRDEKKGKLQVNYGLMTNERGRTVSVSVYDGNTGDPTTLLEQVEKVRDRFGVRRLVLVGDRGMTPQ